MNLPQKICLLFLFIISFYSNGQNIDLNIRTDVSGKEFDNIYTPFTYFPENKIVHNFGSYYTTERYISGKLRTKEGYTLEGLIKIKDDIVYFRKKNAFYDDKFKPKEIEYITTKIDSFFTISSYFEKKKLKSKPILVQYLGEANNSIYVRHFEELRNDYMLEYYLCKPKNQEVAWNNFYDYKENLKTQIKNCFGHLPEIKKQLATYDYKEKDIPNLIQKALAYEKFTTNKTEYYDTYWFKTPHIKDANYHSVITRFKDSLYTYEFYKGETKLYQANYNSLFPRNLHSIFTIYGKNGLPLKTINYNNGEPKEIKLYNPEGTLIKEVKYIEVTKKKKTSTTTQYAYNSYESNDTERYKKVQYSEDVNHLNSRKYFETTKDAIKTDTYHINQNRDTVYQINNRDILKLEKLSTQFKTFTYNYNFKETAHDYYAGTLFLSVTIDPKGYISSWKLVNSLHPKLDDLVISFAKHSFEENRFRFKKMKPAKNYETIIPFVFTRKSTFFIQPPVYSNNLHIFGNSDWTGDWQNHWMWQQQMNWHMQQMNTMPTF